MLHDRLDAAHICSLPRLEGFASGITCFAYMPKFFFNGATGKCESFIYGGCGEEVANRFDSIEQCQLTCANAAPTVAIPSREKCVDGTTKKEDCNTCNCVGGIWACTLMACLPPMKPLPVTWAPPTILTNNNAPQPEVCPQICTMQYDPVCDSNGETHSNKCAFEIAACEARKKNQIIVIAKQGSCEAPEPEVCPQFCTMQYEPVCDSNGVTHGNKCAFDIAACEAKKKNQLIFIAKEGPCQDKPVCQDGETKKEDCNTCTCMRGLWACTMKLCIVEPTKIPENCPPGMRGLQPYCRPALPKPDILTTGVCATSPQLPCCNQTAAVYKMLNGPFEIADLSYPTCRPDGYFAAKQCHWAGCYCVKPNGESADGVATPGDMRNRDIVCQDFGVAGAIGSECSAGETKMIDCNECTCASGIWACTKRGCLPTPLGGVDTNAECTDGATKKKDCNTCVCSNGRWACTLMACFGTGTGTRNSLTGSGVGTGNAIGAGTMNSMAASGEACLAACNSAHNPWKEIGETPSKSAAWNCVDKCKDVTCHRKCEIVYPNRGEELTVMNCKTKKCKSGEQPRVRPGDLNKNYGVKGGLRSAPTKKPSANYGVKS